MKLDVRVVRSGKTDIYWDKNLILFRKPQVYDPRVPRTYEYVQAKCDGRRVIICRRDDCEHRLHVFTTNGIDIGAQLVQCPWFHELRNKLPEYHWLDGELFLEEEGREQLSTALAEESKEIRFGAFGYSNLAWNSPPSGLRSVLDRLKQHMLPTSLCENAHGELLRQQVEDPHNALKNVAQLGTHFDGVVFKNGMYGGWAKYKHKLTIDLIVTAIEPGKGKYKGMAGSLECSVFDGPVVANVSGMTDEERQAITLNDIGRVVEVEYERVGSAGRLQHPRFVAWRDDKAPEDCGLEQDPVLVKRHSNNQGV